MADDDLWKLCEDGYLNVETDSKSIIYHPNLNTVLVTTKSSDVLVLDVNSGVVLQKSSLSARDKCELRGTYLPGQDRVIFTDGKGIGVRKDYNGVLLLDTILQTPVNKPDDPVKLELLLSEALLLQQSLRCVELPGVDQTSEVLQELCVRIKEAQANTKKGTKAQKWNTVCLELPHCALKCVCSGLVQELKRQNRHIPALTIASAINERLNCLLPLFPSEGAPADRALMFSEAARRDTFVKWPHMNYKWALPDQMAQAGFYHQPNSTGDDRAMCFTCNVCLVCWEPTDEPWSEHERHSPACPFVKGEYTQNVPLSVTYATSPATPLLGENEGTSCIGTSSVPDLVATATRQGFISVWNVCRQLKKEASFLISPSILNLSSDNPRYSDIKPKEAWPKKVTDDATVEVEVPKIENLEGFYDSLLDDYLSPVAKCHAVELTALSVIGRNQQHRPARHSRKKNIRPCVVAGVSFSPIRRINSDPVWGSSPMVRAMNDVNEASNRESALLDIMKVRDAVDDQTKSGGTTPSQGPVTDEVKFLYLVVYDFPYHTETKEVGWDGKDDGGGGKGQAGSSAKKIMSGTGTSTSSSSGSRQENNNMYHEIFLSKLMYDVPVIEEVVDSDIVMAPPPECLVESLNFPTTSSSGGIYPPPTAIATSGTYDAAFSAINGGMDMFDVCPSSVVVKVSRVSKKEGSLSSKREVEVAGSGGALPSKKSVPLPSQCIALPNAYASRKDLSILGIHPTKDGGHILVVLGSKGGCCDDSHQSSSKCGEFHPMTSNFVAKMMCEFSDNDSDMEIDGDLPSNSDSGASLRSPFSSASLREKFNSGKSFSFFQEGNLLENNPKMLSSSNCRHKSGSGYSRSALLVYSLNFDGEVVKVSETPINVQGFEHSGDSPIEVTLLPLLEKEDDYVPCSSVVNPGKGGPQGLAALVCQDGVIRILDVPTLKVVSKATPDKEGNRFVSAAYCNSLERLCALADKGSLHFFVLSDEASEDCFEEDTASRSEPSIVSSPYHLNCHSAVHPPLAVTFSPDGSMSTSAPSPTGSTSSSGEQLLVNRPSLGLPELQSMLELTRCENLSPCYAATVPPCWSEMMQAQKQRRHPQHLQQGDELQHTRSWRLQNDASVATPSRATWDEHVFELTLPRSCCVGHVDIKFSLHAPCPTPPLIQVTLLKQNASGIGRKEKVDTAPPVDRSVDFNLNMQCDAAPLPVSKGENPVMCEQYLKDHNTEILCGPVNLSSCLDLSDHSGIITLTSPKLFRIRGRTLLLHIKALVDDREVLKEAVRVSKNRGSEEKGSASKKSKLENTKGKVEQLLDYYLPVPGVTVDRLATAASSKKMEYYLGCDWLHEISITIRRTKQTTVTNERTQRCAMLESNLLAEKLVRVICQEGPDKTPVAQSMALDILIWVASVRLSRHRSCRGDVKTQQMELVRVVEGNLVPLVKHCIIMAGRSVAHKCVKLIIICSEGMKNALDCTTVLFDGCVLQALLEWLPMITCCWSAGALRWYFLLLSRVMSLDVSATTGQKCVSLLLQVAQELRARTNPYHLLLQTRFGLYNTPFEPELFDTEPPVPAKSTSVPITYASVVSQDASGAPTVGPTTSASASGLNFMGETLDLRELLGIAVSGHKGDIQGQPRLKGLTANHYMKGLLEVEPLHFTCHAASDGTKMEKIEIGITPGSSGAVSVPVGNLLDSFNFIPTSSGTKKADNDFISFYEDLKKSEEAWNGIELKFNEANNGGMVTYGSQEGGISVKLNRHTLQFGSGSGGVGTQGGGGGGSSNGGPEVIQIDTDTSSTSSSQQSSFTNPAPIMYQEQAPTTTDKKHDNKKLVVEPPVDDIGSLHLSWQQLLAMPAQHMLVIERMHSGARRFVVLDFGRPVLLTDLMIPACGDLVSLSIDMWCHGEETDGQRLVVASDIGTKSLVMSDLQPPPICRYLKITTIGRYGMSTTRCKIPIGLFYGHIIVLRGEGNSTDIQETQGGFETNIQTQLLVLSALLEDIHCRYNLSCSKLQELLAPLLTSEIPNVVHMHHFLQGSKDTPDKAPTTLDDNKIITAYQECVTFQHQLNLVRGVMQRLEGRAPTLPDTRDPQTLLAAACSDKLRVLGEGLLDVLLYLVYEIGPVPRLPVSLYQMFDQRVCEQLFHCLCVREDTRMQLAACTLLVRMCGLQPWWGDFLANTLARLYSSQHSAIFPQDRVFILLTYLGRKSLGSGAPRSVVLDSVLAMLARLLSPLATPRSGFLRADMDLALISWVLLFLSVCFDTNSMSTTGPEEVSDKPKDKEQSFATRWDFIQGEVAMQKKYNSTSRSNASRSYRRKLQKRLMHHKQQLEDLEVAKKAFHASTQVQALTALSNQAANLSSKLEAALKQQEQFYRKTLKQHSSKHFKDILQIRRLDGPLLYNRQAQSMAQKSSSSLTPKENEELEGGDKEQNMCLPLAHCLPVAKGLIGLILHMDFTCNMDTFLLACKVVARIVVSTRPAISLGELMTEEQLLHLVRLAVASWGGPWASHAICCLLQDIIEGVRLFPGGGEPGSGVTAPPPTVPPEDSSPGASTSQDMGEEEFATEDSTDIQAQGSSSSNKASINGGQLPSVLESDDSELEEFLDDILERGRSLLKKATSAGGLGNGRLPPSLVSCVSTALDARLEYGVEVSAEVMLRRLTALGAYNLPLSVNAQVQSLPELARQPCNAAWDEEVLAAWKPPSGECAAPPDTLSMLTGCFDKVFAELHIQTSWTNLELVLQMWLTLNVESSGELSVPSVFDPVLTPAISLSPAAVSGLMAAFAWHPGISLRAWCLAFQTLTVLVNTPVVDEEGAAAWPPESDLEDAHKGMARVIVADSHFVSMLLRFLSGTGVSTGANAARGCAGPTVCQALHDLLVRLQMRCDVVTINSKLGNTLKELLLKLVYHLVQQSGALPSRQGPLDAQCKLVDLLLNLNFANIDLSTAMSILESVGILVYSYILGTEKVRCRNVSECGISAASCFGGLFASVLGGETKQGKPASWDSLLCNLLKLVNKLVQTPLAPPITSRGGTSQMENMEVSDGSSQSNCTDMSQTDEHKAEHQNSQATVRAPVKVPCVADTVLQHHPTMLRLLNALAGCSGSTLAMLIGSYAPSEQLALGEFGEPLSVGDAVFQLLTMLARKATSPQLILRPLFDFLASACNGQPQMGFVGVMQLSEPLLWFILRVLETEPALQEFNTMGGIKVICKNLVKSNQALINSHPSLVSLVMQHMSHYMPNNGKDKKTNPIETVEGMLNFAPIGTISSSNPTAQPADVLIQSAPPHRRARTPAWSYHFYPDETWVDLTLVLPCAVLLKEVQLQPHLNSLATCPAAVAIEVSRDASSGLIPICPPLNTSGLTFIRLNLPQAEIVTSVLVRLYKPRDSSNIGLSQIRLLGSTTFGETAFRTVNMDVPDEEQLTKSSLGWLRLLHHCVSLPNPELTQAVLASTSEVPGLLEACCGLLLIPAPSPSLFTPHLERVLLKLGLHSRELGLKQINTLLRNGTAAFLQGSIPIGQSGTSSSSVAVDSVVELLYQLCVTQDEATQDRVSALLSWLQDTALTALQAEEQRSDAWSPSSAYVHSAAAILWTGFESGVNYDLQAMVSQDLFSVMYKWSLTLPSHSALKRAIDTLLCSMCYVKPLLFRILLQRMGVLVPNLSTRQDASISDDRKNPDRFASLCDDSKERVFENEWHSHLVLQDLQHMDLTEGQLMSVASACQSISAVRQLLDSGLPTLLTHGILDFCHREQKRNESNYNYVDKSQRPTDPSRLTDTDKASGRSNCNHFLSSSRDGLPMLRADTVAMVLHFFAEVCSEGLMRDWLGSPEGSVFWLPLLTLLCNKTDPVDLPTHPSTRYDLSSELYSGLESATIKFLSRCCWCHPTNQQLLSVVLCDVIGQQKTLHPNMTFLHGISGFTRRLVLQLLLESEKLFVFVKGNFPLHRSGIAVSGGAPYHPRFGVGHQHQLLYLSTQTTCADILKLLTVPGALLPLLGESKASDGASSQNNRDFEKKGFWQVGIGLADQLSVAAGVTAKDKRVKDSKNAAAAASCSSNRSPFAKKSRSSTVTDSSALVSVPQQWLQHESCPGLVLPGQMALSQLLSIIQEQGRSLSTPCVSLSLTQHNKTTAVKDVKDKPEKAEYLLSYPGLPTPLQVFSQQGGLALLAQHLPLVYPDTLRYSIPDKLFIPDTVDAEWVKVEAGDDIYEDLDDSVQAGGSSPGGVGGRSASLPPPSVPPHSLAAFGLFLRLPGYSEVLLRDKKKAQCLLRLVLGVTDDGEGGDIFSSPVASSLHTLPFQVLRQLFDSTLLTTDDGVLLRRTTIDIGAVHLLLGCLSVFTHQSQDINLPGVQHELVIAATKATAVTTEGRSKSDDKSHLYWAKGTGFGTGSTVQSWNVEQALLRQRSEEEHVTVLLQVLSSYINPGGAVPPNFLSDDADEESESESDQPHLPPLFHDLLQQSCLLPAISSYLRNDSVLDMARHIPLYRAVLQLLRAMALSGQLVHLLLPDNKRSRAATLDDLSVVCLLTKMKMCVDTYASRLKTNKSKGNGKSRPPSKNLEELESDEGLALLIPDIQETANLVQVATDRLVLEEEVDTVFGKDGNFSGNLEFPLRQSLEERYLEVMKQLQFDTYEMITECSEASGGYQFVVSYHFESNMRAAGERCHPSRVKRLAQETVTLSTSLPLSYSSSVFVRCDTDRLDIMKVLITGPAETPYANGCFEFDVYFPPDYPNSPMMINLETTGHHTIRFNPNLYNDGKVCLSVLNTWHGRPEEKWNAQTSSFLQVLVSIQSLILVPEPYFNEPGYERSRGTPSGNQSSREYNSNICQASVKWAMLEQIRNPCPCFKEVIQTHFWIKRQEIVTQIEGWIADMEGQCGDRRTGRAISLNAMALKRHFRLLKEEFAKLKTPEGLDDLIDLTFDASCVANTPNSKESSPVVSTPTQSYVPFPPTSAATDAQKSAAEESALHEIDSDIEMEKMVSKVCE